MNSDELARYMEATDSNFKPWLLVQLRLKKLQENKPNLTQKEYMERLEDIHKDLMKLGEWWKGRENEFFNP